MERAAGKNHLEFLLVLPFMRGYEMIIATTGRVLNLLKGGRWFQNQEGSPAPDGSVVAFLALTFLTEC